VREPQRVAPLLDVDRDLGQFLDGARADQARRQLLVRVRRLPPGPWNTARLTVAEPGHLGLLVIDGVMAREVLAADVISTELIGSGELLRPWQLAPDPALLKVSVRWNLLTEARVAVLDRRVAVALGGFPEITSLLVERMTARTQRLAVTQAISQLNRVDQRLLTLFWHLAERWGRMTSGGVSLPLTLSHRMLAQLIGARRPTVSTALGELARKGEVERQDDGSWLLKGEPVGEPAPRNARLVPPRRRFMAAVAEPDDAGVAPGEAVVASAGVSPQVRDDVLARLNEVRGESERIREDLRSGFVAAAELCRRTAELRERRREALSDRNRRAGDVGGRSAASA